MLHLKPLNLVEHLLAILTSIRQLLITSCHIFLIVRSIQTLHLIISSVLMAPGSFFC